MRTSLLLLAFLGLAGALQRGLEYEYRYEARMATGIPELHRQYAGAAVRASITIQPQGDDILAQMTNIEVADMNGEINCDPRAPMELSYEPSVYDEILQKPFLIRGTDGLTVSKDEPYWITNIRKAAATLFTVKPLRKHELLVGTQNEGLLQTQSFHNPSVTVLEEGLAGDCENRYVLTKLPDYLKEEHIAHFEETVEEDVQYQGHPSAELKAKGKGGHGGKGSKGGAKGGHAEDLKAPALGNDVYVLSKAVNFDKCASTVKLQNYGHGINCKLASSQCGTLLSRSSTGSFYLRGASEALRIERVEVEGNVLMNPLGYETEKIRTITNQTLELKAVRYTGEPLHIPEEVREVNSFVYEVDSPLHTDDDPEHKFVQNVQHEEPENPSALHLGFIASGLPNEMLVNNIPQVVGIFQSLLGELSADNVHNIDIAGRMDVLTNLARMMDYVHLNDIFNSYDVANDDDYFRREMMIDIMAKAGTNAAVQVLMAQIKNHAIGTERAAEVFMAFTESLTMPKHSLPTLFEALEGMNLNDEFQLTSSLILNLGSAVNRLCLSFQAPDNHPSELLGSNDCDAAWVLDRFLPIIENGLKEAHDVGHKMVYIHALTMMSTDRKIDILKPIILGISETDDRVRSLACYALQAFNTPANGDTIERIYSLMMPVFENQGDHHAVRIAAIGSLLSWKPDTAWWHRLAIASWKDSSRQMQSFISHLINSVAEREGEGFALLRQRATHVQPMTKHFPPSQRFTMTTLLSAYMEGIETGIVMNSAWTHTVKSYIPVHIYNVLIAQQGSYLNLLLEVILDGHIDDLFPTKTGRGHVDPKDATARRAFNMYSQALMDLRMDESTHFEYQESKEPEHDKKFILAARLFYNMKRIFMTGEHADKMARLPMIPPAWNVPKYLNPSELFVAFPTDIGLAFIGTASTPIFLHTKGQFEVNAAEDVSVSLRADIFASLKVQVRSQVAVPWKAKAVSSGIELAQEVNLPLKAEASLRNHGKEIKLALSPVADEKMHLVRHYNHPFTVRSDLVPNIELSAHEDFKIIKEHKKLFEDHLDLGYLHTGLALSLDWQGDTESPLNLPSIVEFLLAPPHYLYRSALASTLQYHGYSLNYDPGVSKTDTVTIFFTLAVSENKEKVTQIGQEGQETGQFSQQSGGDYDYGQEFQEENLEVEDLSGAQYSIKDSSQETLAKMQEHNEQMGVSGATSVSLMVDFTGEEIHKYGAILTWTAGDLRGGLSKMISKMQATFLKGSDVETEYKMCVDVQSSRPYSSHLVDLSDILSHDLKSKWSLEIREGTSCSGPSVVQTEVYMNMSQERKDTILSTLNSEDFCPKDIEVHEHIQAVYDKAEISITWNEELMACSPLMKLTYLVDDCLRSLLFPHVTINYCGAKNTPGHVSIDATRSLDTNLWTVWTHKPTEVSVIDHLHIPKMIDAYVTFDHDYHHTDYDIPLLHDECHVYDHHIVTFDGLDYPHEKSLCWQVLTMDVDHFENWMLLHRYAEYPEPGTQLRFINPHGGIVADITAKEIKVNGKPVIMSQDREVIQHNGKTQFIVEVYKEETYIEFPDILSVAMKDSHIVVRLDHYTVGGLCGARDGELTGDLQGPNKCVYYDPELFATSWIAGGDGGCDLFAPEVQDNIAKVEMYQSHCPKLHTHTTGSMFHWEEHFDA
ncbi:hemolymph clottable protein-like [Oratosquilla oratoria]|uniref:hemolymph clottable protein-like n=1 Tax=Oratosquilla oratoria TaxID=337810 RepID=UPI003F75F96D